MPVEGPQNQGSMDMETIPENIHTTSQEEGNQREEAKCSLQKIEDTLALQNLEKNNDIKDALLLLLGEYDALEADIKNTIKERGEGSSSFEALTYKVEGAISGDQVTLKILGLYSKENPTQEEKEFIKVFEEKFEDAKAEFEEDLNKLREDFNDYKNKEINFIEDEIANAEKMLSDMLLGSDISYKIDQIDQKETAKLSANEREILEIVYGPKIAKFLEEKVEDITLEAAFNSAEKYGIEEFEKMMIAEMNGDVVAMNNVENFKKKGNLEKEKETTKFSANDREILGRIYPSEVVDFILAIEEATFEAVINTLRKYGIEPFEKMVREEMKQEKKGKMNMAVAMNDADNAEEEDDS